MVKINKPKPQVCPADVQKNANNTKAKKSEPQKPNSIMIGGIKYKSEDVKSHNVANIMASSGDGYREAEKFEVVLKDGTKLDYKSSNYEDGSSDVNTNLKRQAEVQLENDGTINFKGLYNVKITDTPKDDSYRLLGCQFTTVRADRVIEEKPGTIAEFFGAGSSFKPADSDKIIFGNRILEDGSVQKSSQSHAILQPQDKISQLSKDGAQSYLQEEYPKTVDGEVDKYSSKWINDRSEE